MKIKSTLTGLLLPLVVLAAIASVSTSHLLDAHAGRAAVSPVVQDELRLQLNANGFTPSEVQHAAGTFAIAVENSAISGEYTLQLKAQDGTVIKEIQVQKGSVAWTITLSAGQYSLAEVSHPQWECRITVQ